MKKQVFPNGVRVLVDSCQWFHSAAVVVALEGGLIDEKEEQVGISHLLEHLLFKRTDKHDTRQIAVLMDEFGGEINAYTEIGAVSLYGVVPANRVSDVLEFFSELLHEAKFVEKEVAVEKEIIRQEILEANDNPSEITYQAVCKLLWPKHIIRYPVFGTLESVMRQRISHLKKRLAQLLCGKRLIIGVAGNVDEHEVCADLERHFGNLPPGEWKRPEVPPTSSGIMLVPHPVTQVHLALCQQFPSVKEDDYFESLVFAGIFGEGVSSRLFQLLREEKGIAYDVSAHVEGMADRSLFFTSVVLERASVAEAIELILSELKKVREDSVSALELERVKKYVSAQLEMESDSLSSRLWRMVEGELYLGRYIAVEEVLQRVERMTVEDISRFVERRLSFTKSGLVLGGNVEKLKLSNAVRAFCGQSK